MKRIGIWIGVLVVVAAIGIGIVAFLEDRAASRAAAFCSRFKPGTPFSEAQAAARKEFEMQYRTVQDEEVSVRIYGGAPLSLHMCTVKAIDGKVSEAKYSHVD